MEPEWNSFNKCRYTYQQMLFKHRNTCTYCKLRSRVRFRHIDSLPFYFLRVLCITYVFRKILVRTIKGRSKQQLMGKWTDSRAAVLTAAGGDGAGFTVLPRNSINQAGLQGLLKHMLL